MVEWEGPIQIWEEKEGNTAGDLPSGYLSLNMYRYEGVKTEEGYNEDLAFAL